MPDSSASAAAMALPLAAQSTPNVPAALNWLASQQQANGSWGTIPELAPRDTARVLIAQTLQKSTSATIGVGYAWLSSQRGIASNQFLAEQARALTVGKLDAAPALRPQVREAEWVGNRRWNLTFKTGQVLALPQGKDDSAGALMSFARLHGVNRLLGGKVAAFDMRNPDRIYMRVPGRAGETTEGGT